MNEEYKPSPEFVSKVMERVYAYESSRISLTWWLISQPSMRYILAGSGALFGVLQTVSVF